jgi:DNA-binding winged helix-turn-helix (wHTH) protein
MADTDQQRAPSTFYFGRFELDVHAQELRQDSRPVRLQPQPLRVLAMLVERRGQVVTRQELQQAIWGADTFVDFEKGLGFCIWQIREALDDSADHPRYVETIPRRGYRFIAALEPSDGRALQAAGTAGATGRRRIAVGAATVAVFAFAGSGLLLWQALRGGPEIELANPTQITAGASVDNYPSWRPGGTELAYESDASGNWDVWITHGSHR